MFVGYQKDKNGNEFVAFVSADRDEIVNNPFMKFSSWAETNKPVELIDGVYRFGEFEINEAKQTEIQKQLTDAVQHVLDAKAQELLYDNCLSVCSYIDTGVPKFDAEGRAFRAWRSAVWAKGYEILAQVQAGQRAIPTEEQLIAELPKLVINY